MQLVEGERRLELGVHYQIPYPRLHHAPQFKHIPPPQEAPLESKLTSRRVRQPLASAASSHEACGVFKGSHGPRWCGGGPRRCTAPWVRTSLV